MSATGDPSVLFPPDPGGVRRPRSSPRTWLIAVLSPTVLWVAGCLVAAAHLPEAHGGDCTAESFGCMEGTRDGAILLLVAGLIGLVPFVTLAAAVAAAIGRNAGKVLLGLVLGPWAVVSIAVAIVGPD